MGTPEMSSQLPDGAFHEDGIDEKRSDMTTVPSAPDDAARYSDVCHGSLRMAATMRRTMSQASELLVNAAAILNDVYPPRRRDRLLSP
jgi:hypothetical protein